MTQTAEKRGDISIDEALRKLREVSPDYLSTIAWGDGPHKPSPALSIEEEHDNVRELPPKQATDPMEYWIIQRGRADEEISILTGQVRIAEQHIRQAEADKAEKLKLLNDACEERARCVAEIRRLEDEAAKPKV